MKKMLSKQANVLLVSLALSLGSCAPALQAPKEELGAAEMAVRQAEREDHTSELASAELQSAKSKLDTAQAAMATKEYLKARRFSEQAIVDAELAIAKTEATKSSVGAREEASATRQLKTEILRNE